MKIGMQYSSTLQVGEEHLACAVGSGDLRVLATPMMLALMENAAMLCVAECLDANSTTVGSRIESSHLRPTGVGQSVKATAELTQIEGRKLTFKVWAEDANGLIGEGTHTRYVVDKERFMQKIQ